MTNYAYRMAAYVFLMVAIIASAFYKMALDSSAFDAEQLTEVTGGLIALWMIAIVMILVGIAEKIMQRNE